MLVDPDIHYIQRFWKGWTAAWWKGSTSSAENLPPGENDKSNNENDPEKTMNETIVRLFNSDIEGDFSGFSAQEEERDNNTLQALSFINTFVKFIGLSFGRCRLIVMCGSIYV